MKRAYLTFDDGPSIYTDRLVDFLCSKNVPAIFFVHGENMMKEHYFPSIVRAIKKGIVIGNHSLNHNRASEIGFEEQTRQIIEAQKLIDRAYHEAGRDHAPRYFRFPHLDRGCGNAHVIDMATVEELYRDYVRDLFWEGVRIETKEPPTAEQIELKNSLQKWFIQNGFKKLPTPGVTFPWWVKSELSEAVDSLVTFSTSDWMMGPRHAGKDQFKTTDALKNKIDTDPWLNREDSAHIILMHDDRDPANEQREDLLTITENLVNHMLNSNFTFLEFKET
ncbi:MAG: hypothetical protein AUJ12_08715 [Alphaproteobacteria bacterium CG1_02_46_17]|nr:MAG: hypothetical protein AUJ12_08715 [Alphaproteobacteria bacterium CG1_02_46_17]